jgi:hypothetical protein
VLFLLALALQDLGPEIRDEDAGFALRAPEGWRAPADGRRARQAPEGGLAKGTLHWVRHTGVVTLARFAADRLKTHKEAGSEAVKEEEAAVDGRKARRASLRSAERRGWAAVIERAPGEHWLIELGCAPEGESAGAALFEKILASARFFAPEPTAEERAGRALAAKTLKAASVPAAQLGEFHWVFERDGSVTGTYRATRAEANVSGRAGYECATEAVMFLDQGGRQVTTTQGRFLLDGTVQSETVEVRVTEADWKLSATFVSRVEGGKLTVTRTIDGATEERSGPAPEAGYLGVSLDCVRSALAVRGKASYAIAALDGQREHPVPERIEVAAPERMKVGAETFTGRVLFSRHDRTANRVYTFEESGRLYTGTFPGGQMCRRVTKEEYDRAGK